MPPWLLYLLGLVWFLSTLGLDPYSVSALRTYDEARLNELRDEVKSVFYHAYDSYLKYAYPLDELRPLSCDGVDTWGSYSLTLIDTLDTLAVMGNYSEFRRVAQLIIDTAHFDMNINVSVFETNIRIIGGLLSAHLLSHKAGMDLEKGWPCNGPLLRLAEKVAKKLLPAFDTPTGMPYGTVNLRYGVPPNETPITCTAGVGTFIVEFGTLSRLTGDPLYEKVAMRALNSLFSKRSSLDLVGNHIDTLTGKWTAIDSGIGAGVDSYFEYLVKGAILFQKPELMHMFRVSYKAIEKHLGKGGWYIWASMGHGHVSTTTFQSLETFWPGLLSLVGEFKTGIRALRNYHRILKQYGGLPELYNILQGRASSQREGYPLRPELVESTMYLYRATKDPYMLEIGEDLLYSIEKNARTDCGYATIRDVTTFTLEDRMESFFLAETLKYLYLLFDPHNFLHSEGDDYQVIQNPWGKCVVYAGGWQFNTEAHPIDPSALHCCTGVRDSELHQEIQKIDEFKTSVKFRGKTRKRKAKKKPQVSKINEFKETSSEQSDKIAEKPSKEYCYASNPLMQHKRSRPKDADTCSHTEGGRLLEANDPEAISIIDRLLQKLFTEQQNANTMPAKVVENTEPDNKPGITMVSNQKEIEKLVQKLEKKKNTEHQSPAPSSVISTTGSSNRIITPKQSHPDLDLIFGSGSTARSISFYFSLKWLKNFPDLIRQVIPAETFDFQSFHSRLNHEFSNERFFQDFNLSRDWVDDFTVLNCPSVSIPDRFMFFKSNVDE